MASLPLSARPNPLPCPVKSIKTKNSIRSHEFHRRLKPSSKPNGISSKSFLHQISSLCKQWLLQEALSLFGQMECDDIPVGPEIYAELLQGCLCERALREGRQIHARIIKNGSFFAKNEYLETKLLIFYAKCGLLEEAEELFLRQRRRNVFSWAAMIGLLCTNGFDEQALMGFCGMIEDGAFPDNFVIPNALKACSALQLIGFGKGAHGYALKMGFGDCVFVLSSLVDFYGKCGLVDDARKVFEVMPERNVVTWNSMLVGFLQNGQCEEVTGLFYCMRVEGVQPTRVSIATILSASANLEAIDEGRQAHAIAVISGLELDSILGSALLNFYCKVGLVEDAESVFSCIDDRDEVTWNLMIAGYVHDKQLDKALYACYRMREDNFRFDSVTLSSIIAVCADCGKIRMGKVAHGFCIRNDLDTTAAVANTVIDLYASSGRMEHARRAFDVTNSRGLVLWNTLISGYAQHGLSLEAMKCFHEMQREGLTPNVVSWNSVILGYLQSGRVNEAVDLFRQMQLAGIKPSIITWATIILGSALHGCGCEAILLFEQMLSAGVRPSALSIVGALQACAVIVSTQHGRVLHGYVTRKGLLSSPCIAASLVDMYAQCGSVNLAKKVFDVVSDRELLIHNAMISGYAMHGQAREALAVYRGMRHEDIQPDDVTFTALLSACTHAGMTEEGLEIFAEMTTAHHITPAKEQYIRRASLLEHRGVLRDACQFTSVHVSLRASSKGYCETESNECVSSEPSILELDTSVNYVRFTNTYAASARRNEASKVRALMKVNGYRRNPERSWIQIGRELHSFEVGDRSHPQMIAIFTALWSLDREMRHGCFFLCSESAVDCSVTVQMP